MIDRTVLICLGLSAICAAALPLEFRSEIADTTTTAAPSEASVAKPAVDAPQPAINRLVSAVLARPLFSPSRHPPEAGPDDHLDTPLSDLRLTGILITPDERLAIFAPANSKPVARSEGDMISNWRVDSIANQSVSLVGPSGNATLEPKADPNLARLRVAAQPASPPPQNAAATSSPPPAPSAEGPGRPPLAIRRSNR